MKSKLAQKVLNKISNRLYKQYKRNCLSCLCGVLDNNKNSIEMWMFDQFHMITFTFDKSGNIVYIKDDTGLLTKLHIKELQDIEIIEKRPRFNFE